MNMSFDEDKLKRAQAEITNLEARQAGFTESTTNRTRQSIANQLRQAKETVARQMKLRDASGIDVQQPTAGGGLSYGDGDGTRTGSSKRLPVSQKLVELQSLLADRTGKVGAHELATLNYMIARQRILDNNLLPATDREEKLQAALAAFRKTIFNLREKETKELEKQLEKQQKLQASFDKEIEDRKYKLGLISKDEYNQLLIRRERKRLEKAYPGEEFAGKRQEAEALYQQEISPTPFQEMRQNIAQLKQELTDLLNPVNQITGAANAIGTAFSQSFASVINGSATTQEALAGFFRNVSNYFLEMASQIITKMITLAILNTVVGLLPGGGSLGGVTGATPGAVGSQGFSISGSLLAANGAAFDKGLKRYAMGGIVDKPTMFAYANGGTGRFGLMGEAGPEAIMPLNRGADGKLGVAGGGGVNVGAVNITVENTGEQLTPAAQKQIANQVQGIVMATLVNERRSGGVLR
jgi:lambda family phage tail tape measure protein